MTARDIPHEPRAPIGFTPVKRGKGARADGWTEARQRSFIEALAATGSVRTACDAVGLQFAGAYRLRKLAGAESFAAAWDAAVLRGTDAIRDKLIDHSLNGIPEPVYHAGKVVGERRRFNHRSMMWMVERGDRAKQGEPLSKGELDRWRAERAMDAKKARAAVERVAKMLGVRI